MKKVWHIFGRVTVLLLAALWLQTTVFAVECHGDNTLCENSGPEAVCTCDCHKAFEPAVDSPVYIGLPTRALVPALDETIRGLLLPDDIFRPPLANS